MSVINLSINEKIVLAAIYKGVLLKSKEIIQFKEVPNLEITGACKSLLRKNLVELVEHDEAANVKRYKLTSYGISVIDVLLEELDLPADQENFQDEEKKKST